MLHSVTVIVFLMVGLLERVAENPDIQVGLVAANNESKGDPRLFPTHQRCAGVVFNRKPDTSQCRLWTRAATLKNNAILFGAKLQYAQNLMGDSSQINGMAHVTLPPVPKIALITGGARRIGRAIALHLAIEGWDIAIHAHRSVKQAHALQKEIEQKGRKASVIIGDVRENTEAIVKEAHRHHQELGALINNASIFVPDTYRDATPAQWDDAMAVNAKAVFFLSQHFARSLPETQRGCIIHISDQRVFNMTPHFATYAMSQFLLHGMTRCMALAFAPRVRVNEVAPGPILPHEQQSADDFHQQCMNMPLGHGGTPATVAHAVSFLLHNDAVTGQTVRIDGGQSLGWQHQSLDTPS